MKKGKLRVIEGNLLGVFCKGCNRYHVLNIDTTKSPCWSFNGDYDRPTFTPSVLSATPDKKVCHSFITDGKIQYLSDCSHELSGQTIELDDEDD